MSFFRTALLGAVCLLSAKALQAMPAAQGLADTPSLPLQQALRAVWHGSPEIQAARADLDAARARARAAAQPVYNPALSLDAENADVDRRTVGLSLAVDWSGKRRARAAQGAAQLQVSQASYDLVRRDIAARWLKAWSAGTLASRQRELGERRLALMRRFDELAGARLKVGDISSPERDLAGLALGEAQIQQAALLGNEASAKAALAAISGDAVFRAPGLPSGLPPASWIITPLPLDERPESIKARASLASSDAGVLVARRARIPDPTVSLTGGRANMGTVADRVIGIGISIPLPILNTGRAEIDAARAEADAATANMHAQQFMSKATLQEAQARYDALREASRTFRAGRAAALDDRARLLERLWRAGEISTSDYLVQLRQSLDTALSSLNLESQTWQAWFDYLSAAGRLTDWMDGPDQDAAP